MLLSQHPSVGFVHGTSESTPRSRESPSSQHPSVGFVHGTFAVTCATCSPSSALNTLPWASFTERCSHDLSLHLNFRLSLNALPWASFTERGDHEGELRGHRRLSTPFRGLRSRNISFGRGRPQPGTISQRPSVGFVHGTLQVSTSIRFHVALSTPLRGLRSRNLRAGPTGTRFSTPFHGLRSWNLRT
jgi:hypothetical protein